MVLPEPATPTIRSSPRPEAKTPVTAACWLRVSVRQSAACFCWIMAAVISRPTRGPSSRLARRSATASTACSAANTDAAAQAPAGAGLADEGDALAVADDAVDDPVELFDDAAVEHGCGDRDHVGPGERLALGERAAGADQFLGELGALAVTEMAQRLVLALVDAIEAAVELSAGPSDLVELV